jgi:hypothetical protein
MSTVHTMAVRYIGDSENNTTAVEEPAVLVRRLQTEPSRQSGCVLQGFPGTVDRRMCKPASRAESIGNSSITTAARNLGIQEPGTVLM